MSSTAFFIQNFKGINMMATAMTNLQLKNRRKRYQYFAFLHIMNECAVTRPTQYGGTTDQLKQESGEDSFSDRY
jgi:hypothetical protein